MTARLDHPCLSCSLPDCDDKSPRCPLRRIASEHQRLRRRKLPIPAELDAHHRIARYELYYIALNERRRAANAASRQPTQEHQHA